MVTFLCLVISVPAINKANLISSSSTEVTFQLRNDFDRLNILARWVYTFTRRNGDGTINAKNCRALERFQGGRGKTQEATLKNLCPGSLYVMKPQQTSDKGKAVEWTKFRLITSNFNSIFL